MTASEPVSGFGTVSGVPGLPGGFAGTFESQLTDVDGVRLHTVSGGDGPPLLLVSGWPQTWYAWRYVMPRLAEDFRVIAVDPRGVGVSDAPDDGYDSGTLARELVALMDQLGHRRFALAGHDVGMWTSYAAAADHPDRIDRLVLAEANIPGVAPSPPLLGSEAVNDRLWHFAFNRKRGLNEERSAAVSTCTSATSSRPRRPSRCPSRPWASTCRPWPAAPTPSGPASSSTAPSTRSSPRTSGAVPTRSRCRC